MSPGTVRVIDQLIDDCSVSKSLVMTEMTGSITFSMTTASIVELIHHYLHYRGRSPRRTH